MKPALVKWLVERLIWLIVGAISGGTAINISYGDLKFQIGQLEQIVEVIAPENPVIK